jgi:superfamily II DNA/RNA helicase
MNFSQLGLNQELLEALSFMGFKTATPIQEKAIPAILEGRDLIACAQTGTGKTAAFILPILHKLINNNDNTTDTLVIVPTRELVVQIDQQVQGLAYFAGIDCCTVYGGGDGSVWETEKRSLTRGANIIIATPGRLISHINMGYVNFSTIKHLVLDEADRMLDIGFYDDIVKIIKHIPEQRQTLMFSATMPPRIRQLASRTLIDPFQISISVSKPAEGVTQEVFLVFDNQKVMLINHLVAENPEYNSILIFCSTKKKVTEIVRALQTKKYAVAGISSDLEQKHREEVLLQFISRNTRVLVATDVLSRGIDIKNIDLVINYDVPHDAEDYVHRVGRTARAETTGRAITFVNDLEMARFQKIDEFLGSPVPRIELPDGFGNGPVWDPRHHKIPFGKSKNRKFHRKGAGGTSRKPN